MRLAAVFVGACVSFAQWRIVSAGFIDASTCVDPSGFSQCYSAASSAAATCFAKNCHSGGCNDDNACYINDENDLCAPSCICVAYQTWINCALTSCWNQVNSCDYQRLAIAAFENCPTAAGPIPHFPADPSLTAADDEGGCSCPVGYVYARIQDNISFRIKCSNGIPGDNQLTSAETIAYGFGCTCCGASESVSLWYNICPNTAPSAWPSWANEVGEALSVLDDSRCTKALTTLNCTTDPLLSFQSPGSKSSATFYDEATLPANGTESLSNLPGDVKTVTSATLIWALVKGVPPSTAVAAPYQTPAGAGAATSASSSTPGTAGNSAAGTSASGGASQTGSVSPATTSKSAATVVASWLEMGFEVKVGMLLFGAYLYL